uniref:uncharacterized protein LOC114608058 n=1 Tax=Podarcis muralis TaxID=64176 RepID=UPI0010A03DD2|nr:uncharacterized protein LOC114608058 [Podarcis muralis]
MKEAMLLFGINLLLYGRSASLLVLDYPVSLYYPDSRLSTVLWLRPAYCLYEQWTREDLDPSQASRKTATIEVEVKPEGYNHTYKIGRKFPIPYCGPVTEEPLITKDLAYEVGPTLVCLQENCTKAVLPGRGYSARYLLYNQIQTLLAATNWSQPFHTRGLPISFRSMDVAFGGLSGGLVAVIVLLSITVFLLLGAAWLIVAGWQQ